MGYLIVRRTVGSTRYLGWMHDDTPITQHMSRWLMRGETMEILEYVPNIDPRADINLIPQLNLWRDHLKEQDDGL